MRAPPGRVTEQRLWVSQAEGTARGLGQTFTGAKEEAFVARETLKLRREPSIMLSRYPLLPMPVHVEPEAA